MLDMNINSITERDILMTDSNILYIANINFDRFIEVILTRDNGNMRNFKHKARTSTARYIKFKDGNYKLIFGSYHSADKFEVEQVPQIKCNNIMYNPNKFKILFLDLIKDDIKRMDIDVLI